jgi:uncharacterized protein
MAGHFILKHLTILVKPASSLCNLRCRYCFYHSLAENRAEPSCAIMSRGMASLLVGRALDVAMHVNFAFQGGEPTLAGLEFYQFFVDEVKRQNSANAQISYSMQTNGACLTEEFAGFLRVNGFLVGLSLDGPKDINDAMRVDAGGQGAFRRVMDAAALLQNSAIPFNILSVVTAQSARHIEKIYRFFRQCGFQYLQFIPCLDPLDREPFSQKYSLTPEAYARFLIRLFELWAADVEAGRGVSIRFFDNLLQVAAGYPPEQCGMQGKCAGQLVVESDGSLYPCDFYCTDSWRIGNIRDMTFTETYASPVMQRFIETSVYDDAECRACGYRALCRGGCRRDRDASSFGQAGDNQYCVALKEFYAAIAPKLPGLLRKLGV